MRCVCYYFHDEGGLEDLLVELWVWLEKIQIEMPEIEIRLNGGAEGNLLIWLKDDPSRPPMRRYPPPHREAIFSHYDGCGPAGERSISLARAMPRITVNGGDAEVRPCRTQRSRRLPEERPAVYRALARNAGGSQRNVRHRRHRFHS